MSILDTFKGNKYKKECEDLRSELERLQATFTPEMREAEKLNKYIQTLNTKIDDLNATISKKQDEITSLSISASKYNNQIIKMKEDIVVLEDELLYQSFGIYKPRYKFTTSDEYKKRLDKIREKQKIAIKSNTAANGNMAWTVNGSNSKGRKMVKDLQKLLLRAFNSECDDTIDKVKFNNIEASEKRIRTSQAAISKLGEIMQISISEYYFNLKMEELHLAYEYAVQKQKEKDEEKRIKEELREQAKLLKEIEAERKKIEKEQGHYKNQLAVIENQLADERLSDEKRADLENKKKAVEEQLSELDKSMKNVDYRAANQKAGYVYIISNIGAFGENMYKIGMTRRLDPMDRVSELGDASVPFNFDVHAMIFSDNAPALEAALHNAFADKKVNMINTRREFFYVTLDEIEAVVRKNYDKSVEFIRTAPAEQYRQSKLMRKEH